MNNPIKNLEGWSPSIEETPEYFGAIGALSFKNENIMCDKHIKIMSVTIMNLITPKAGAKHEPLFNYPVSDSLYVYTIISMP